MTTNQNPKNVAAIMFDAIVTVSLLAFIIFFGSCTNSRLVPGNYSKYNHFRDKGAVQRIADSLYKVGDSSCFVMKKDGKWCLACKDSLKFKK